jgi:SAM-dependent methyltransferase
MNYEQAVDWLRAQPEHRELVDLCYLDADVSVAARRFAASDEAAAISDLLGLRAGQPLSIADVGCGNGISSFAMAQFGHHVYGIDPDPSEKVGLGAYRQLASCLTAGSMKALSGTAESIGLDTESVDRVYTRQSMHHFRDLDGGVKECARILKRGGIFLGSREHVVSDDLQKEEFLKGHLMQPLHGGENAFRVEEYHAAFAKAGLRLLSSSGAIETIINYYPGTEAQRIREVIAQAHARWGRFARSLVSRSRFFQKQAAKRLASCDSVPGRLYTFLAVKA